jgi:hypothetical protein
MQTKLAVRRNYRQVLESTHAFEFILNSSREEELQGVWQGWGAVEEGYSGWDQLGAGICWAGA